MTTTKVYSLVTRLVNRIPFKVICIIVLFIPLVPLMVDHHYLNQEGHTPSSMCSPRYPGYSKVLDMPVILPDGGVQAGGWQYPPGAVWWDSGVAQGCPCSVGHCIRPCCHHGFYNPNVSRELYKPNITLNHTAAYDMLCSGLSDTIWKYRPFQVFSLTEHKMVSIPRRPLPVLEANCYGGLERIDAVLTTDGNIMASGRMFEPAKYGFCFIVRDTLLLQSMVYRCRPEFTRYVNRQFQNRRMNLIHLVVLGYVTPLLIITLVTYLMVPHLRPAHCGGSVLSYIVALLIDKFLTIGHIWCKMYYKNIADYLKAVGHTWTVSMMMWQGLIVYQMWTTFNPHKVRVPNRYKGNSRFIWYSVAIWVTVVVISLFNVFNRGVLFNLFLQCTVLMANLGLSVSTLFRLRACLKASKVTQGPDSHRHNIKECQWASLFIKFSFLTSLEYTLIILLNNTNVMINGMSVLPSSSAVYLIGLETYILYLWGAETFFLNVWNKRTWEVLGKRFISKHTKNVRIA